MSETLPEVRPVAVAASDPLTRRQRWIVLGLSLIFALMPFFFIGDLRINDYEIRDLQATGFFFSLGLLPGAIGIVYHLVTATTSRSKGQETIRQYYVFRNSRAQARAQEKVNETAGAEVSSDPLAAIAASLFLTGIFLLIAVFAGFETQEQKGIAYNGVVGMMYAGLGAYVAVLYYMVARLYANALSPRFLLTSALRTSSCVALGWVFGIVGITAMAGPPDATPGVGGQELSSHAVLFLVGLFHNSAIEALRKRAAKLFGTTAPEVEDIPLMTVEGIDDTTRDLLTEYGVSTIQHLATSEPGDLCDRTLLPLDRILDWVDQALLIRYLRRNIAIARTLGIRGAINLALVHARTDSAPGGEDAKLLASLAEKVGIPAAGIDNIARDLRNDYMVALIYELQQGRPFPAGMPSAAPAAVAVSASPARIQIRDEAAVVQATAQPAG
ncbi:MAG: hypothetical protein QOJ98_1502 [Acidobacteriota bacterium]|nr:hypothetical protein [Acidobacteriota bacterium]